MINKNIQVLIPSYNCAKHLKKCFRSVEKALQGHKWILIFCDDDSNDETEKIIQEYKPNSSAELVIYKKFNKAKSVGEAKNRAFKLSLEYKKDFPILCPMDADDEMGKDKITGLLPHVNREQPIVFGDYIINYPKQNQYVKASLLFEHLRFAWWAALYHSDIVPKDGKLLNEELRNFEDVATWWKLRHVDSVPFKYVEGFVTHYYNYMTPGSIHATGSIEKDLEELGAAKNKIYPCY
jgi:glycosyltransferase involved in cell wall biosynthesis